MASSILQELNETIKLVNNLDENAKAIVIPAQADALLVKLNNYAGPSWTTADGSTFLETLKDGPFDQQQMDKMTNMVVKLMKPRAAQESGYKPQHLKHFVNYLTQSRADAIAGGTLHFDKVLELAAQQLCDVEAFYPAESTCGRIVRDMIELGDYAKKDPTLNDANVLLGKCTSLKSWVKILRGSITTCTVTRIHQNTSLH